jgi:CheY-like chemotaxis protein
VKQWSSVAAAARPSVNCLAPWLANQPALQEEWGENRRRGAQSLPLAHHDSLRILVVNDSMRSAARLRQTLFRLGFSETLVAYSGKRALAAVAAYSPAVAIVDLDLCDMTGYSLARSLRSHTSRQVREIPLIAVAEHSEFATGELARAAGFLGLLSKPVPSWLLNGLLLRSLK